MLDDTPKFLDEIYRGDYAYLGAEIIDDKPEPVGGSLLLSLCDNSVGISREREERLTKEPAQKWLGDLNWREQATRKVTPTPVIDDAFRKQTLCGIPVLLIHGDLDLATPIENAEELLEEMSNAHLIRVEGGAHGAAHYAAQHDARFMSYLSLFMDADELRSDPGAVYGGIPEETRLPPLKFAPLGGESLFDRLAGGQPK